MKRFAIVLSLGLGVALFAGCEKAKRDIIQEGRGVYEHQLSKHIGSAAEKADSGIDKATDSANGDEKQAKDRNALKGSGDDSEK